MLLSVNVLSCIISVNRAETKALVQALVELIYGLGLWVVSVQMLDLTTSGGRLLPPKPEVSSTVNRTQLDVLLFTVAQTPCSPTVKVGVLVIITPSLHEVGLELAAPNNNWLDPLVAPKCSPVTVTEIGGSVSSLNSGSISQIPGPG